MSMGATAMSYLSTPTPVLPRVREPLAAAQRFWGEFGHAATRQPGMSVLLDGYAGDRLRIGTFSHQPHVLSSDHLARHHRHAALLVLQLEGESSVEQHGRRSLIRPGDFCLVDLSRPFRVETGRSLVQVAYLPLAVLRDALPRLEQVAAVGLHGHLTEVGFLRGLYRDLFERAEELTEPMADRLVDAIPHVLAVAASSVDDPTPPPSQLRQHHKDQVRRYVREHLADPGLCAEVIARGVGLSASYLFELFADEEMTLMRWVRTERLARCRRELADPALRYRSIAHIAQAWGFGDMTHFGRSFREAFGMSPRAWRTSSRLDVHAAKESPSDGGFSRHVATRI
ncbi:helix-turn-helix domain-containing protein [Bacillus sp. NP157]|nr:helix-turn-helix domain-containing protein [Bacillus sp. NP157]